MAEPLSGGSVRVALGAARFLMGRPLRAYRRVRWHRHPGWSIGLMRQPPAPDLILIAAGPRVLQAAEWEVQGPRMNYLLRVPGKALANHLTATFPAGGFQDKGGHPLVFDELPRGRYWVLLFAWEGSNEVPVCKVPFRIYDVTSRFWRWYETRFLALWERFFRGATSEEGAS